MTTTTITGAQVWDSLSAAACPAMVRIEGKRITAVGTSGTLRRDTAGSGIDGSGHAPMPGLVEGHGHPSLAGIDEPPEPGLLRNGDHMLRTALNRLPVRGDVTQDVSLVQHRDTLSMILKDGVMFKDPRHGVVGTGPIRAAE